MSALTEIVAAAEQAGWNVKLHTHTPIPFATRSVRDGNLTVHEDFVVEIVASEAMRAVGFGDDRNILVLFRQSGALHTAFRSTSTLDEIEAEAEAVAERSVEWNRSRPQDYSEETVERYKAQHKAEVRYRAVARSRVALTKAALLEAIEKNPLHHAEIRKANDAIRRQDEIVRLREQVIPNHEAVVAQATEDAQEALEAIKDAVRATHPSLFIEAPGLLDSVVLAVLGTENDGIPAVAFIHARARIEQSLGEIERAKGFLAQFATQS